MKAFRRQLIFFFLCLLPLTGRAASLTYTYDAMGRLTDVDYDNGIKVHYGYDAMGNRLAKSVTIPQPAPLKEGDLNPDFSSDGKDKTGFSGNDFATAVLVQPDGRIIVLGHTDNNTNFADFDFAMVRYNVDGGLDSAFGQGGKVVTAVSLQGDFANDGVVQPDGKIIIVGASDGDIVLARYDEFGKLDTSFNADGDADGLIFTDLNGVESANEVALLANGKIVVAAQTDINGKSDFVALRYNVNGGLDTSFGVDHDNSGARDGWIDIDFLGNDDIPYALALQDDGKILLGGFVYDAGLPKFGLARLNADGTLDASFNPLDKNGKVLTEIGAGRDGLWALGLQSDQTIIAGGYSETGNNYDYALAAYLGDGSLDATFGLKGNGIVVTDFGGGVWISNGDFIQDIVIQDDDKILAIGMIAEDFSIVRYNPDGTLDTGYGDNGKVIIDMGGVDGAFGGYLNNGMVALGGSSDADFGIAMVMGPTADLSVSILSDPKRLGQFKALSLGNEEVNTPQVSFRVIVENHGPETATGVRIFLKPSDGTNIVRASWGDEYCQDEGNQTICVLGALENHEQKEIEVEASNDGQGEAEVSIAVEGRVKDIVPHNNEKVFRLRGNEGSNTEDDSGTPSPSSTDPLTEADADPSTADSPDSSDHSGGGCSLRGPSRI